MNLRDWTMNCWGVLPVLLRRAGAPPIVRDVRFRELNVWTGDVILETARCTPRRFGEVTSRNNSAAFVSIVDRCASGLTHRACLPQLHGSTEAWHPSIGMMAARPQKLRAGSRGVRPARSSR